MNDLINKAHKLQLYIQLALVNASLMVRYNLPTTHHIL